MDGMNSGVPIQHWRDDQSRRGTHIRGTMPTRSLFDVILRFGAALCIVRGAQLWYGWPTAQDEFVPGTSLNMQAMLFILLGLSLFYIAWYPRELLTRLSEGGTLLYIFLSFILLSVVASVDVAASARGLLAVVSISLPILLFRWRFGAVGSFAFIRAFAVIFILANLIYCVVFPHYAFMSGSLAGDMRGLFPHKNGFGHTMATLVIILMPTSGERWSLRPSFLIRCAASVLALFCVVESHSSTAVLQTVFGIASIGAASLIRKVPDGNLRGLIAISAFLAILAIALFVGTGLMSNIVGAVGKDMTLSGRSHVWAALIPHILDYPFTGHGFAMFRNVPYTVQFLNNVGFGVNSPHSTYIELLLNLGIPGAVSWFLLVLRQLYVKLTAEEVTSADGVARNREIAIIMMTLIGATTEAGQMLAPLDTFAFFLLVLPLDNALTSRTNAHKSE